MGLMSVEPEDTLAGRSPDGFFVGSVTLVTEDHRIAEHLHAVARRLGGFQAFQGGTITLDIPFDRQEEACQAFDRQLTAKEQEEVFAFLDAPRAPRLLSLKRVIALQRHSWFSSFLTSGAFSSHLQPIVDLVSGTAYGFEALLRAHRADGSPVRPEDALHAAQATGQLPAFDALAREAALAAGRERLLPSDRLFVNIDPDSVPRGFSDFQETLELTRTMPQAPDRIVFELIESEGVARRGPFDDFVNGLREAGFRIALDDLESGYSTLGVLEHLRPDIVKLNQRLVRGAHADRYRARLVKTIVDLSRDLEVELIVEGVETSEDCAFVRALGIRLAQGFFLSHPRFEPVRSFPVLKAA